MVLRILLIIVLLVLLECISAKWIYKYQNKCAVDDVGQRRFFTAEGYRKCTEENCPFAGESVFTASCCHLCCYNFVKPSENAKNHGKSQSTTTDVSSKIEGVMSKVSYVINVVLVAIIIGCVVLFYRKRGCNRTLIIQHSSSNTDQNVLLPTTKYHPSEDTKSAATLLGTSSTEKSIPRNPTMQHVPQLKTLVTADSTRTISGKRFEVAVVNELSMPPSYHYTLPGAL